MRKVRRNHVCRRMLDENENLSEINSIVNQFCRVEPGGGVSLPFSGNIQRL